MEEVVGKVWHKLVSRWAYQGFSEAEVLLEQIKPSLAIFFRAMGGDAGLKVSATDKQAVVSRRRWLQRLAGGATHVELAWRDQQTLLLPAKLDNFSCASQNRAHYYWLAALASVDDSQLDFSAGSDWFCLEQQRCLAVIQQYPGLRQRYQALVEAHIELRPNLEHLKSTELAAEQAVRQALRTPGTVEFEGLTPASVAAVNIWLRPASVAVGQAVEREDDDSESEAKSGNIKRADSRRHRAEYQEPEDEKGSSLIAIRHETDIFSLSEMFKLARPSEDDEDSDEAGQMAEDLEQLTLSKDQSSRASRVRFDLDLPAASGGELELEGGKLLPEWDYKKQDYRPRFCRIIPILNTEVVPCPLPLPLRNTARRLRQQFSTLINQQQLLRRQEEGDELDLEAVVESVAEQALPQRSLAPRLYQQQRRAQRDLACLVLADLSLSTEAGLQDDLQVIDVIRDSLFLFSECLQQIGDPFAVYGFSSRKRDHVRFNTIKGFDDSYNDQVRGQLQAIKPGFYTRMGAAIRQAIDILQHRPNKQKLLLIISDGKPSDLDQYDGRYGIEDTRKAILEARQQGLVPFCLTVDHRAEAYLPYVFGHYGYRLVQRAEQLPQALPEIYRQLTDL